MSNFNFKRGLKSEAQNFRRTRSICNIEETILIDVRLSQSALLLTVGAYYDLSKETNGLFLTNLKFLDTLNHILWNVQSIV